MNKKKDYLFQDAFLFDFVGQRNEQLRNEIDRFDSDYIFKVSLEDLTSHLAEKYQLEPVVLLRDSTHIGQSGDTKLDVAGDPRYRAFDENKPCYVPATFVEFVVPFTGDPQLLRLRPSTYSSPPHAQVAGQELRFRVTRTDHDHAAIKAEFEHELENVEKHVAWSRNQTESYNKSLPSTIRRWLDERKEKLLKDRGLVEALGYPIKPRVGAGVTYIAPVARKKLPIEKPTVSTGVLKLEPFLEMGHYEHILGVVFNMVVVMERSPGAFSRLHEEGLRTHILVQLNGHYEGQATGETFNNEGKTDILIRVEGRNIFIAECKFWRGAEGFSKTIDQLLGYAAWRDTKTAIILFNRNKDTSAVLQQIPGLVKKHPNYKREDTSYKNETGFRFVLHHRDDKNRELILTVLVFDVPT